MPIEWDDFEQVDMRVGKVVRVEDFPESRNPSYWMTVDFGPEIGVKHSSAAIREIYHKDELVGRQVVAVVNFPPKQIAHHLSEVLVLAAVNSDGSMRLLGPDAEVQLGSRIA